jgi:tetratricopeptide (TPR) repeat protein
LQQSQSALINALHMEWWRKSWKSGWLPAALIILLTLIVYLPALHAGFNWDDDDHLTNNPCIVGPLGLKEIWTTSAARICPLVLTTFWGEHRLWGLNPLPYHLVNVLMHALTAALLWRVLTSLHVRGAWLGAALWALHPVQVESVAWITELKNTQSGLFFVLAVWFFVESKTAGLHKDRSKETRYYFFTLFCGLLAMTSKSSTVILPGVLALCAWWIDRQWRARDIIRLAPLAFLAAAAGCLSMWTQHLEGAAGQEWIRGWPERIIVAGKAFWFYLSKLVWPHPLIFIYPRWQIDASRLVSYLPALAIIVVAIVLWRNRNGWGRPGFLAFAYFLVALLPVLGFLNHYFLRYSFVGDHFQYLASMGPLALAGSAIVTGLHRLPKERWLLQPVLCAALLLILGILTWRQSASYYSPETLWRATISKNPGCWMAQSNLGDLLLQRAEVDEAILHFEKAVEIWPDYPETQFNLGSALLQKGLLDEAAPHFRIVLETWPRHVEARNNLGGILLQKGQVDEAIINFEKILDEKPADARAHNNLGNALEQKGQLDEAIAHYRKTLEVPFDHGRAHYNLANALMRKGEIDEAIAHYRQALELQPNHANACNNLGNALRQKGSPAEAIVQYQRAVELEPQSILFLNNLAWLLATSSDAMLRDGTKAVALTEQANQLNGGNNPMTLRTLAAAYAEVADFSRAAETIQRALDSANAQGSSALAESLQRELSLYQNATPYREP